MHSVFHVSFLENININFSNTLKEKKTVIVTTIAVCVLAALVSVFLSYGMMKLGLLASSVSVLHSATFIKLFPNFFMFLMFSISSTISSMFLSSKQQIQPTFAPEVNVTHFQEDEVTANLPGRLQLFVNEGDLVEKGTMLGSLEMMKMTISLYSTNKGRVKQIFTLNGAICEKNQKILSIEPSII